jgi:hypothetical protein
LDYLPKKGLDLGFFSAPKCENCLTGISFKGNRILLNLCRVKPIGVKLILVPVVIVCTLVGLYLALWTGLDMPHVELVLDELHPSRVVHVECAYNKAWAGALYAVEVRRRTRGNFKTTGGAARRSLRGTEGIN